MADALLSPAVAAAMYGCSGTTAALSLRQLKKEEDASRPALMAVTSALVFAGQMVNYTIPGTGSSGHICGGMLLSAILGPQAGFLSMTVILTIQCLLFADGGLMALGANCWNMAFYGCFIGYYLFWRPLTEGKCTRGRIVAASVLGCVVSLQLGAFSVVLETCLSGVSELPLGAFCVLMQPIHLVIGAVEGLVTAAVLLFLRQARPALLHLTSAPQPSRCTVKTTLAVLGIAALFVGGGLSLLASRYPDGLEWALSAQGFAAVEEPRAALFPDYGFSHSDSAAGTSVAGLVGSLAVAAAAVLICLLGRFFRKKK